MRIYFAGASLGEKFDEKKHAREDLPLFSLSIEQKENEIAIAQIKIENTPEKLDILKLYERFFISWENNGKVELLFAGVFSGLNKKCEDHFCYLELYAASPGIEEEVSLFLETHKEEPYWDPLFVPFEKRGRSLEIQDTRLESLYVDPKDWGLKRSSFFEGSSQIDLKGNFIRDSFSFSKVREPLRAVSVKLKAEWIQEQDGYVNIARAIERKFPSFKINSFSSIAIEANWPRQGQKMGRSGYEVIASQFDRVDRSAQDKTQQHYSPFSPPLKVSENAEKYYVKRHWYYSKLHLRWQYRQKRRECLAFTLNHDFQTTSPLSGETKEIAISLQNINPEANAYRWRPGAYYREGMLINEGGYIYVAQEDHKSSYDFEGDRSFWKLKSESDLSHDERAQETFFLSARGQLAFEYAMALAQYHLAKSARAYEIEVSGAWEDLAQVTTDHSLSLEDSRIPGGKARGKVISYRIYAEGKDGRRAVDVTIAPALGIDPGAKIPLQERYETHFASDGYCEEGYLSKSGVLRSSAVDVSYYAFQSQSPRGGFLNWRRLNSLRMVKRVQVKNGPLEQLMELSNSGGKFRDALKSKQTQVQVQLYDLRTKPCLEHRIEVALAEGWSAPQQIILKK